MKNNLFKKWTPLFVLSLSLAIIIIDGTVLNVSLSNIIKDLNTDLKQMQTVITTYSLIMASFMITGGRLGDIFGRKKMFILGAIIFGIGSLIASISTNITTLLIGWSIIEGIGAALMMPATASLILSSYQGKDRALAFGIWGGIAGAAAAFGPLFGGYITTNFSWHWAFLINIFVIIILILFSVIIKESQDKKTKKEIDFLGIFLSVLGLSTIVYPIIESSTYGWWYAKEAFTIFNHTFNFGGLSIVPILITIGSIILTIFYLREQKIKNLGKTPIIDVEIFKNKEYSSGLITISILVLAQAGMIFILPIYFQGIHTLNALQTGEALLPMSVTALLSAPLAGLLSRKIKPKYIVQVGLLLNLVSILLLKDALTPTSGIDNLTWPLLIFGVGMGFVMAQITNITLSGVKLDQAGEASGVLNTARQIGSTLGSAIIGAIFLIALTNNLVENVKTNQSLPDSTKNILIEKINTNAEEFKFGSNIDANSNLKNLSQNIISEIKNITNISIVESNKTTMNYTFYFTMMAFIVSFFLPIKNSSDTVVKK